jgi:hypothetical protein
MTPVRSAYLHLATVAMDAAQDGMPAHIAALGAAVTRSRIDGAFRRGSLTGPDGRTSHWEFLGGGPGELERSEAEHATRLIDF